MPKQKDLKRIVRSRMQKTGEAYTAARRNVLGRSHQPEAPAVDHAALAGMSDATVRAKTGRDWAEWTRLLDAIGAASLPHRDIARHVHEAHGVDGWWSQAVTVGYERIRGLREKGQRRGGAYEASKSKTLPVPLARLYRAWATPRARARWLPGVKVVVRKATPEKSLRITWEDGSSVECYFTAKGGDKSAVAVQHGGLAGKDAVARAKRFWEERLAALAALLVPG